MHAHTQGYFKSFEVAYRVGRRIELAYSIANTGTFLERSNTKISDVSECLALSWAWTPTISDTTTGAIALSPIPN